MVGVLGFEPRTSSLSGTRSNQLSYTPSFPQKVATLRSRSSGLLLRKSFGYFSGTPLSGIPCGFAVLMPARLDDVCQNRLLPNCPARYFLIFRSRCDNGAPRHLGAARLPLVEPKGLEPSTSCLQSRCSSQLSYGPLKLY